MQNNVSKFGSRVARFETLESRELLSVVPNSPELSDVGGVCGNVVVAGSLDGGTSHTDVTGVIDELEFAAESFANDSPTVGIPPSVVDEVYGSGFTDELSDLGDSFEVSDSTNEQSSASFVTTTLSFSSGSSYTDSSELNESAATRSGGTISSWYSGGGIQINNRWVVVEGDMILISVTGASQNDVVTATISGGVGIDSSDFGTFVNRAVIGQSNQISLTIAEDNLLGEGDEDFSINLKITHDGVTSDLDSYAFTIAWTPEFDSDDDYSLDPSNNAEVNDDHYRIYLDCRTSGEPTIQYHYDRPIGVFANPGGAVRYSLVPDLEASWDATQYFRIDPYSGAISFVGSVSSIPADLYTCDLKIKVENDHFLGISGGNVFYDEADVAVSFAKWDISRENLSTASAEAYDGCTVAELAHTIGLSDSEDEFRGWLTDNWAEGTASPVVELFNGTFKSISALLPTDVLANTDRFEIPNTIYATYCYDPSIKNTFGWYENLLDLRNLGFAVETFYNESYSVNQANEARSCFLNNIATLSESKYLHGIYWIGHGSQEYFTTHDGLENGPGWAEEWGPRWEVTYTVSNPLTDFYAVDEQLEYKLGAVIIQACHSKEGAELLAFNPSEDSEDESVNQDDDRICVGFTGITYPMRIPAVLCWTDDNSAIGTFGGKQGTQTWSVFDDPE